MKTESKAKSLIVSILMVALIIGGLKELVVKMSMDFTHSDHLGMMALAVVGLAYTLGIAVLKAFYNSSNAPSNWTKAQIVTNVCVFILLIIGLFNAWAVDNSVELSNGFIDVMLKVAAYCNLGLSLASTDWSQFKNKIEQDLNRQ